MVKKKNNVLGISAQTQFFHLFKVLFDSGEVKSMGTHTFTVYAYIKSCVNYDKGGSFPSINTIVEKTGVSRASVFRCLQTLTEMGYISTQKKGKHNVYKLNEQIPLIDEQGEVQATASWEYVPKFTANAIQELKDVLNGNVLADNTKFIHIDKIQVIVSNVESGASQNIYNGDHNQHDAMSFQTAISTGVIPPNPIFLKVYERSLLKEIEFATDVAEKDNLKAELLRIRGLLKNSE